MNSLVLDYSEYVEMSCEEEDGVYRSYPSAWDAKRSAVRFINHADMPSDPLSAKYEDKSIAINRWQQYLENRMGLFGKWYHYKNCPYCNQKLELSKTDGSVKSTSIISISIRLCHNCGWWDTEEVLPVSQDDSSYITRTIQGYVWGQVFNHDKS